MITTKLKKEVIPTKHSRLYTLFYFPKEKILWMEVLAEIDIKICVFFMRDAITFFNKVQEPIQVLFNLSHVKKYNPNCIQAYQMKEHKIFIEHPHLGKQVFIGPPPYIKAVVDLLRMFTDKGYLFLSTEKEAGTYLTKLPHLK